MESDEVRVGVYVCHCGLNIAGVVDCPDVAARSADLLGVVVSKDYRYMCSDQNMRRLWMSLLRALRGVT